MTNSELFYRKSLDFQNRRKAIVDEYEKRIADLQDMKGSKYFTTETEKAVAKRDAELATLKEEYRGNLRTIFDAMSKSNRRRSVKAPTQDELNIVSALKMRDSISPEEFETIANSLRGNRMCLQILQETAHKMGVMRSFMHYAEDADFGLSQVDEIIDSTAKGMNDFIEYDTVRAARVAMEHHARLYGSTGDEKPLPKRPLFETMEGCFADLFGVAGDSYQALCRAIDNE